MINPKQGWFEMVQYEDKRAAISIANLVENNWLSRYPRLIEIMYDQGKKYIDHEFRISLIKTEYGITVKPSTLIIPISNAVLERIQQVPENLLRTFYIFTQPYVDKNYPWTGVLAAGEFAICSTTQRPKGYISGQLIFLDVI